LTVRDARNPLQRAKQMMPWLDFGSMEIVYLKLEFTFRLHGKPRRIMVKVKPPGTVSFRRDVFEARIMEHLRRNGLCVPRPDLFSAAAD
jgi:Ser/Thr protein kinase RdoA (MazF antagonist)